jgi:hypothetical protein
MEKRQPETAAAFFVTFSGNARSPIPPGLQRGGFRLRPAARLA